MLGTSQSSGHCRWRAEGPLNLDLNALHCTSSHRLRSSSSVDRLDEPLVNIVIDHSPILRRCRGEEDVIYRCFRLSFLSQLFRGECAEDGGEAGERAGQRDKM